MKVGVVKEIKDKEHRVALTPAGVKALHKAGHTVLVQAGAGLGAGFSDAQYGDAGAHIVAVAQAWDADLVLKVKEPLAAEYPYLQEQIVFTYLERVAEFSWRSSKPPFLPVASVPSSMLAPFHRFCRSLTGSASRNPA